MIWHSNEKCECFSRSHHQNIALEPSFKTSDKSTFLGVLHQSDNNSIFSVTEHTKSIEFH